MNEDTPRSNAHVGTSGSGNEYSVHVDYARQLERELNEVRKVCSDRYPDSQLLQAVFELRAELEKLKALNHRCICVYCKKEFNKDDIEPLADHILSCEKSPLVQLVSDLKKLGEDTCDKLALSETEVVLVREELDQWRTMARELAEIVSVFERKHSKGANVMAKFSQLENEK